MGDTDFEFGWNARADNANPWGRSGTGPDDPNGRRATDKRSTVASDSVGPVSSELVALAEKAGYSGFVAVITDDFQTDAFLKCVSSGINSLREEIRKMAIPKPTAKGQGSNGRAPAPKEREGGDFYPWLKIGNLMDEGLKVGTKFKMKVLEAREAPAGNISDVIVDVEIPKSGKFKGGRYAWGLSADKGQYASLYGKYGDRLDRWKGTVAATLKEASKKGFHPSLQVL